MTVTVTAWVGSPKIIPIDDAAIESRTNDIR